MAVEARGELDYEKLAAKLASKLLQTVLKDSTGAELSDFVKNLNVAKINGAALTARDWSSDFAKLQNLDILLSALRDTLKKNEPVTVLLSAARTANGDTYATPLAVDYGSVITFFLDVTAVSGTTPTLDLYIDIQDPVSGKWVNQDKFPQVTATGTYALSVYVRSNRYAVRWVLGGTTPSFTFSVGAVIIK
jgi:hypothetical protein